MLFQAVEKFNDRVHLQDPQRANHTDEQPGSVNFQLAKHRGYREACRHGDAYSAFLGLFAHLKLLVVVFEFPFLRRQVYVGDLFQLVHSNELGPQDSDVNKVEEHGQDFKRECKTLEGHPERETQRNKDYVVDGRKSDQSAENHLDRTARELAFSHSLLLRQIFLIDILF